MSVLARPIGGALAAIVGQEAVVDDRAACASAAVDGLAPRWIVRPASLDEVSRVLALAWDAELAVVPRGGGHALELGHPPSRLDLVLDLRRLDHVVEYNPDDLTVTVEAGATMEALTARVGARRQLLPLDPGGVERRTLGGLAATNASGPLRARYGTLRDLLLGVRFAREAGATLLPLDASFWTAYGRATTPEGAIALAVGTLVTLVGETAAETERAVAAAGPAAAITGSATLGSLRATFPTVEPRAVRALVERLRALVAPVGGSVIIQRAPAAVRAAVDPWGPLEPDAFALMRGLKDEFDAKRVLNPGRFVGGL